MDKDKAEVILERMKALENKVKMAIPENRVVVEHTLLFGRFKVKTVLTHIDLKKNWLAEP